MKRMRKVIVLTMVLVFCFSSIAYAEGFYAATFKNSDGIWVLRYSCDDGLDAQNEWKQHDDNWYYFGDDGNSKNNTWFEINDKWYYFDSKSVMLHDTVTPDGYTVGSDGAWIESEPQITESIPTTEAVGPGIN